MVSQCLNTEKVQHNFCSWHIQDGAFNLHSNMIMDSGCCFQDYISILFEEIEQNNEKKR